jgi:hypothetical protein
MRRPVGLSHASASSAITVALVLAALVLHEWKLWPYTRNADQDFDAVWLYFPLARDLIAHGLAFFADERSLQAPPFSYVWPALLGPELERVRMINAALSGITLLLAARTARIAHSRSAAVGAAFLFAASPLLRQYLATPITEPIFILLSAIWIWSFFEWLEDPRIGWLAAGAAAIMLAALTRATMFYWIVAFPAALLAVSLRSKGEARSRWHTAFLVYAAWLVLPVAFIAKDIALFGFPFYATGAGNALYLGNNPVTGGYDPNYLGLIYDVGSIARDQSQLTLGAERLLAGVARFMIAQQDPWYLATMHLRKLGAFLFVTAAEPMAPLMRSWRIALLLLSALGAAAIPRPAMRWTLIAMCAYQVAFQIPVLYTHRYSVDALDLWLGILASSGMASLLARRMAIRAALVFATLVAAIGWGRWLCRISDPPQPDVFRAARITMWEQRDVRYDWDRPGSALELRVTHRTLAFDRSMNFALVVDVGPQRQAACRSLVVTYRKDGQRTFGGRVERRIEGLASHRLQVGARSIGLDGEGVLRLQAECNGPTILHLERVAVFALVGSIDFRERYLHEPQLFPGLVER